MKPTRYLDPAIAALLSEMDPTAPPLETLPLDELRAVIDGMGDWQGTEVPVETVEDVAIEVAGGSVPLRVYRPGGNGPKPVLVYARGGGWVGGSIELADRPARLLAIAADAVVVSVGYRRAPEHRCPIPAEDVFQALKWAAGDFAPWSGFLAIAGDSSGGNLAAAAALMARDRGGPPLAHQLLIYPALARDFGSPSYRAFGEGFMLTRSAMEHFWQQYVGGDTELLSSAYAEPLRIADLRGVPAATILVCGADPLRSDGEQYAARLAESGVPVTLVCFEDLVHAAFWMAGISPRAAALVQLAGQAIRNAFAQSRIAPSAST